MPDYLTRVAIAGARTGRGVVRPVRVTAAAMPRVSAVPPDREGAVFDSEEPPLIALDVPRAAASEPRPEHAIDPGLPAENTPPEQVDRAAAEPLPPPVTAAPPSLARLIAPHAQKEIVRMPRALRGADTVQAASSPSPHETVSESETSDAAEESLPPPVTAAPPSLARLVAPHAQPEIVRMPRAFRGADAVHAAPSPRPHETVSESKTSDAAAEGARSVVEHATPETRVREHAPERERPAASEREPSVRRATIREARPAAEVAPAVNAAPVAEAAPSVEFTSTPAIVPRAPGLAGDRTPALPTIVRESHPSSEKRSRVTIGRVELQVHQPSPPTPPAAAPPARASAAPAGPIEARFLDRLLWKP